MTDSGPVRLQVTFDGLRGDQLQRRWIERVGGVEAYVFDGVQLDGEDAWRRLRENLRRARDLGADPLTLHFPTDNADWVHDSAMFAALRRFCELAVEWGAEGVVLHANQFVPVDDWPTYNVPEARKRVVAKLAELDQHLTDTSLWIGVENMPVIGSAGIDFDSIFVEPKDFDTLLALRSPRIGVTWDICHWAITYTTLRAVAHLRQEEVTVHPLELPAAPVRHIHFASFAGHAMPYWAGHSFEGTTPQRGEVPEDLLASMLCEAVLRSAPGTSVVFEVQEDDYVGRTNCWQTRDWVAAIPALAGLVLTEQTS